MLNSGDLPPFFAEFLSILVLSAQRFHKKNIERIGARCPDGIIYRSAFLADDISNAAETEW